MDHYTAEQRAIINPLLEKFGVLDFSMRHTNPPALVPSRKDPTRLISQVELAQGKVKMRDPKTITTLAYHQTATMYGTAPYQIKAAGGDKQLARNLRAARVAAHVISFQDGTVVHNYPLLWYVYHGNSLNAYSLGHEMEGAFLGRRGGRPAQLSPTAIESFKRGAAFLVEAGRALGCPLNQGRAHRQVASDRRADPGEEPWKEVALPTAAKYGLEHRLDWCERGGRPIPVAWDNAATAEY